MLADVSRAAAAAASAEDWSIEALADEIGEDSDRAEDGACSSVAGATASVAPASAVFVSVALALVSVVSVALALVSVVLFAAAAAYSASVIALHATGSSGEKGG